MATEDSGATSNLPSLRAGLLCHMCEPHVLKGLGAEDGPGGQLGVLLSEGGEDTGLVGDHPRNNERGAWARSWSHILEKFLPDVLKSR